MLAARLLVIDDDPAIAAIVGDILGSDGYTVERTSSPEDALTRLAAQCPGAYSVVLTDSFAGPQDAPYGWLDQLRSRTTAPIIICTGWPSQTYADHRARGFAAFLAKPFEMDELLMLVASLVGSAAPPAALGCPAHSTQHSPPRDDQSLKPPLHPYTLGDRDRHRVAREPN